MTGRPSEPSISVPMPLSAPRQGLTFSLGMLVAAALAIGVIVFVGYIAFQVVRFSRPPDGGRHRPGDRRVDRR